MADLFSTDALMGVVRDLKLPGSTVLDRYFPELSQDETEEIHFDVIDNKRRLAPFVSPYAPGKVVDVTGQRVKTFKPAYVKDKRPFDIQRPLKRVPGERIGGGYSAAERVQILLASELEDMQRSWRRRLEWMAIRAVVDAAVTVVGDDYASVTVNFGRAGALTPAALATTARWGESAADPITNLETWADLVHKESGVRPTDVLMDVITWGKFRKNQDVKDLLDQRFASGNGVNYSAMMGAQEGAAYMGSITGFNFFVYSGWFVDPADGVEKQLFPAQKIAMVAPVNPAAGIPGATSGAIDPDAGLSGVQAFGAIRDHAADFVSEPFFVKSWLQEDPSVRWVMAQSAPLVVPRRVNASLSVQVHG